MKVYGKSYQTVFLAEDGFTVQIIDQTRLPHDFQIASLETVNDVVTAIQTMMVRGAPLIGATAAYGICLAMRHDPSNENLDSAQQALSKTRPTAVNLHWALTTMGKTLRETPVSKRVSKAYELAQSICEADVDINRRIGNHGYDIIENLAKSKPAGEKVNILTHCNAGWLATVDWGTATAPIYTAHDSGLNVHVWVDETRPRNQGANLTSYELNEEQIPNTIIADNTGGILMQRGEVDMCIVGTDRTLATGDVCNKIGTYLKALAAKDNNVPFYVALPSSTIDWNIKDYKEIPIEERNSEELSHVEGLDESGNIKKIHVYPKKSKAMNLAFDVTPAKYVTALITEKGICEASSKGLKNLFNK